MTAGQSAYYNLMRPRQGLEGKTPAEAAALKAGSVDGNGWPGLIGEAAHQNETGVKANGHQPST